MSAYEAFDAITAICGHVLGLLSIPLTGLTIWLDRQPTVGFLGWLWTIYRFILVMFGIAIIVTGGIYGVSIALAHL